MTIGNQIRYASLFVGLLALVGCYVGWNHTLSLKTQIQDCTDKSVDMEQALREVQENLLTVHQSLIRGIDPSENLRTVGSQAKKIKAIDKENGEALLTLVGSYQQLIATGEVKDIEKLRALTYKGAGLLAITNKNNEARILSQSSEIEGLVNSLSNWIIWICLLMSVIAIVLGQVIARGLSISLNSLDTAAKKMREGDFSHRVELNSSNEFGQLGNTFNTLAAEAEQAEIIEAQKGELENLNQQLKLKNDSLDSFVYRVSHDLKAPLVNILSLQKIIKSKIDLESDLTLKTSFAYLEKNAVKLDQTVHDLLDISRIERNLDSEKSVIKIQPIVDGIIESNIEDIQNSGTKISCDFADAPEVNFNPANLLSALANIITNAIKYRKEEGQNLIEIASKRAGENIIITVKDNGIGLDLDRHQHKLFNIFSRFHNHVEGSGVGLYIVKKLMDENDGSIAIQSEVGVGTTLTLSFLAHEMEMAMA